MYEFELRSLKRALKNDNELSCIVFKTSSTL